MPKVHEPPKEPGEKRNFITEKIVRPSWTKRRLAQCGLLLVLSAVLFGVIAAVSFAISYPWAVRQFGEPPPEESLISIPKDDPTEEETEAETARQPETQAVSLPFEDVVRTAISNYHYTVDDLNDMLGSLRIQVQKMSRGLVVVHSVQQETDWFDNPVETTTLYSGAIIAATSQELLVLTPEAAIEQADSIKVTFANGVEVGGRIKQRDTLSGMAIVAVNTSDMDEATLKVAEPVALGNSYMVREGDLVAAVGSPAGVAHSVDYGFVSYIKKNEQMVDLVTHVFYSRVGADASQGTFFVNTSGELVGWALEPDQEDEGGHMSRIMGISDYKGILEKLTNGLGAPCIGVEGQEVSDLMAERGLPRGIYVLNSVTDRPAYDSGIQNGDIITRVDNREVITMKDFQNTVDNLECGQLIHVTVQRNGPDHYAQLEFQLTVGAR